ncbi:MAG: hypothetical protein JXA90_02945 [Planctomycetes bacterium]|nr:hypothetical protein [Planctomycetota bacterium]
MKEWNEELRFTTEARMHGGDLLALLVLGESAVEPTSLKEGNEELRFTTEARRHGGDLLPLRVLGESAVDSTSLEEGNEEECGGDGWEESGRSQRRR